MSDPEPPVVTATSRSSPDLRARLLSAIVMAVVAGAALMIGRPVLDIFVGAVALGLLWEFAQLVWRITPAPAARGFWMAGGTVYIFAACASLLLMPAALRWIVILAVIATDTGAYFAGRGFGGRKIAPAISPSKTWAGLFGGMAGASLVMFGAAIFLSMIMAALGGKGGGWLEAFRPWPIFVALALGCLTAILAQAGDFFESWMKRRAGVKDSGALIPGHGGLFDRVDGLLPVAIAAGLFFGLRMAG